MSNLKFVAFKAIIASTLWTSPLAFVASAEDLQGFVQETPKFDLSLPKNAFQLGIEHTEIHRGPRKPILHAQDKLGLLRGGTRVFKLNAADQNIKLQAQYARTAKNAKLLQGGVDKNGDPLIAKVEDNPRFPLYTNEHFHSPFQIDLRKLTTNVAPDIVYQMDSELNHANNPTDDELARQEKAMETALQADAPRPDMPSINPITNITAAIARAFESQKEKAKEAEQQAREKGIESLKLAMTGGTGTPVRMPNIPRNGKGDLKRLPANGDYDHPKESAQRKESEREMTSELASVNTKKPLSSKELDAKISDAQEYSKTKGAAAEPNLNAVVTRVHPLDLTMDPASIPKYGAEADVDDVVPWDEWHTRFANLARDPILLNVSKLKKTSGFNTVEITVWRNLRVDAKLTKSGNPEFDRAILDAYKSLNGNKALAFPNHSRRDKMTFLIDNEHKGAGAPTTVQSQTSRGDKEVIRYHI